MPVRIVEHATRDDESDAMLALILEILLRIPIATKASHGDNTAPQYHVKGVPSSMEVSSS